MKYNTDDYRSVAERIQIASTQIQVITTESPVMISEVMGYIRCTVVFNDGRSATGTASFRLDAKFGAQKTHPLEDAETSAIGRALAFLGIGSSRSIASQEEMNQVSERENMKSAAHMDKLIKRIKEYQDQAKARGIDTEHDFDYMPLQNLSYDQLVDYGIHLKSVLGLIK